MSTHITTSLLRTSGSIRIIVCIYGITRKHSGIVRVKIKP